MLPDNTKWPMSRKEKKAEREGIVKREMTVREKKKKDGRRERRFGEEARCWEKMDFREKKDG